MGCNFALQVGGALPRESHDADLQIHANRAEEFSHTADPILTPRPSSRIVIRMP